MGSINLPNDDDENEYTLDELEQDQVNISLQTKKLLHSLQKVNGWRTRHLYLFQGFWCQPHQIHAALLAQAHFPAQDSDVVVASVPKSGTTWLKALAFAITRRADHPPGAPGHPLLAANPHDLVPFLEYKVYVGPQGPAGAAMLDGPGSPRLVATHVPYGSLPDSVKTSSCKIVYICRNPLDTFVSAWHFLKKARPESLGPIFTMEEAFDMYCKGEIGFGPYWDHMLGYWRESLRAPDKVMFMKYEDMKGDAGFALIKKLAEFLGYGFSNEEERDGVVDKVAKLCSFETLKGLEVNKSGKSVGGQFENNSLFRKGEVGDWANHLTKDMAQRFSKVMDEKLAGSGLEFMM